MNSSEFYDGFINYQIHTGINDRIFSLYKRLCSIGISEHTSILEIGCGIGSLTYLLSRKIRKGTVEAVDFSSKSIEYAKKNIVQSNVHFYASDILNYKPEHSGFDFVLLFDVLEHIKEEEHALLFQKIAAWTHPGSILLINLPNPYYILFDQKNQPQVLQEVDQPIFIDKLATHLSEASWNIECFETYSVWVKNDYQFIKASKKAEFTEVLLRSRRSTFEKVIYHLRKNLRKLYYKYPQEIKGLK